MSTTHRFGLRKSKVEMMSLKYNLKIKRNKWKTHDADFQKVKMF